MAERKVLTFQSNIALEEWKLKNEGTVSIISIGGPDRIFGHWSVSRALLEPYIIVEYLDFSVVSDIGGFLKLEDYYLTYDTGELLLYD